MTGRQIIIGDIHGCYDELLRLLEKVGVVDGDLLVSVGDLVDRGPKSIEVCEFFRGRKDAVVLMGNHQRKHIRGIRSYAQEIVRVQMGARYDGFIEWMAGFPYYLELESAIVVHAAFEHDVELAAQREDVLAGTTSGERYLESRYGDAYWTDFYSGEKPIIFGHHVVGDEVVVWNDRVYGIDTGACHGGRLTALVLPEFRIVQVDGARDYWIEQKRLWQPAVLRAKPWSTLSVDAIERELARADRSDDPALEAVAAAVRRWLEELSAARSRIAESIDATVNELLGEHGEAGFARAAAAHPAKGWLFRHRRDPVGPAEVAGHCSTAEALASLAETVGVQVAATPDFGPAASK